MDSGTGKIAVITMLILGLFMGVYFFVGTSKSRKNLTPKEKKALFAEPAETKPEPPKKPHPLLKSKNYRMALSYLHVASKLACNNGRPPKIDQLKEELKKQAIEDFDIYLDHKSDQPCQITIKINKYFFDGSQDFKQTVKLPLSQAIAKEHGIVF